MLLCKCAWTQPHIGDTNIWQESWFVGDLPTLFGKHIWYAWVQSLGNFAWKRAWAAWEGYVSDSLDAKCTLRTFLRLEHEANKPKWICWSLHSHYVWRSRYALYYCPLHQLTSLNWVYTTYSHTDTVYIYIYIIYMVKSCKIIQVIQDAQGGFLLPSVSLWELRVQCLRSSFGSCRRGASPGWVI